MKPATTEGNGTPTTRILGENVKQIINYTAHTSSLAGGGAEASSEKQQVANITLGKGINHSNMDNTAPVVAICKRLKQGYNAIKVASD